MVFYAALQILKKGNGLGFFFILFLNAFLKFKKKKKILEDKGLFVFFFFFYKIKVLVSDLWFKKSYSFIYFFN